MRLTLLFLIFLALRTLSTRRSKNQKPPSQPQKILRLRLVGLPLCSTRNKLKETVIQFSNSILGWTLTNIVYTVADGSLTKCPEPMRKENLYTVSLSYKQRFAEMIAVFCCIRVYTRLLYLYCILYFCTFLTHFSLKKPAKSGKIERIEFIIKGI